MITLKKAKKKAWKQCSLYIRLKNSDKNGFGECYTCGKRVHHKKANAGHGIAGRTNSVLFDERIIRFQCVGCNIWGNGQYPVFTRKLIEEMGMKAYDKIVSQSGTVKKYTLTDYEEIEHIYKEKVKKLMEGR